MRAIGLIPSRLKSTRLPSKALLLIDGIPVIIHTLKRAQLSKSLTDVYVCTDSEEISDAVRSCGGKVIMTEENHQNGTERIAEAAKELDADIFVDIQGDEPLVNPAHIDAVIAEHIRRPELDILVPSLPITHPENQHIVKIVHDKNLKVVFMSRSVIPNPFRIRPSYFLKHLSVISFKPEALKQFSSLKPGELEKAESIELLRALENNMVVGTMILEGDSFSIDIKEDYTRAKEMMKTDTIRNLY